MLKDIDAEKRREIITSAKKLHLSTYFSNKSQRYQFACHTTTEEMQEIRNPRNKFLEAN